MGIGGPGNTVGFSIVARADLRGVEQTAKALAGLSTKGTHAGDGIERGMDAAARSIVNVEQRTDHLIHSLDRVSTVGFAVGTAIFAGLGLAIKGASDLAETVDKAGRTFGENFKDIDAFSKGAAESMGLSRREALDAASGFGLLFNSIGAGSSDVLRMSKSVTQLAADLGSLFNVGSQEAQQALLSGLIGESEPLRRFNIILSETKVQQELLASGQKQVNGEWTEAQKVLARYNIILREGAPAAGNFIETQDGLANSAKTASAQLKDASDALGTVFLPIAASAAQTIGDLAGAFTSLPDSVQHTAAEVIALAGGLSLAAAGGAKMVSVGVQTAATWSKVATAIQGSARAMTALTLVTSPAALGIGAIAAVSLLAIQRHRDHERAVHDLEQAYKDLGTSINNLKLGGQPDVAQFGADLLANVQRTEDALRARREQLQGLAEDQEAFAAALGFGTSEGLAAAASAKAYRAELAELNEIEKTIAEASRAMGVALETPGVNAEKMARNFNFLTDQLRLGEIDLATYKTAVLGITQNTGDWLLTTEEQTKSLDAQAAAQAKLVKQTIDQRKEQEATTRAVRDTLNAEFLASTAAKGLTLPFSRDAEDIQKATESINQTLADMTREAGEAAAGLVDISSAIPGTQVGFRALGSSVTDVTRAMDDVGALDLSDSEREALDLQSALEGVERRIEGVNSEITNNQEDLAMWSGRLGLVTSVLGGNSEELARLIGLLQSGKITQEEFNAAIASGALGPFEKLDALLASGAISQDTYNRAKEAGLHLLQRSAGGIQDENAELVLNLIALDNYVRAHDDADGAVKGLTDSQRGFIAALQDGKVQLALQLIELETYLLMSGQIKPEQFTKFVADLSQWGPEVKGVLTDLGLLGEGGDVPIDADTTAYDDKVDGIKNEEIPDKTVTIRAQAEAGLANIPVIGGIAVPAAPETDQPEPVVFTAENKVTPVIDEINQELDTFATDAATKGQTAGEGYSGAVAVGIGVNSAAIAAGVTAILGMLDAQQAFYNTGFNDGYGFSIGEANGIMAGFNAVFNAAFNVGYAAHLGTQAGMQAHSPSRLAAMDAQNWVGSFVDTILRGKTDVRSAAQELSAEMRAVIATPANSMALRGLLTVDQRPAAILAESAGRGGGPGSFSLTVNVGGVHGVTDPEEVADVLTGRVVGEISRAWDRGTSAGVFGS